MLGYMVINQPSYIKNRHRPTAVCYAWLALFEILGTYCFFFLLFNCLTQVIMTTNHPEKLVCRRSWLLLIMTTFRTFSPDCLFYAFYLLLCAFYYSVCLLSFSLSRYLHNWQDPAL